MAKGNATDRIVKISILEKKDSLRKYWLFIIPGQSKVQNWFCKGYGHIAVLTCDEDNWYLIDPQPAKLKFSILPFKKDSNLPIELAKFYNAKACIYLLIDSTKITRITYRWWHFFIPKFIGCVSLINYILGVKLKGMTPLGVVKHLKKLDYGKLKDPIKNIKFLNMED